MKTLHSWIDDAPASWDVRPLGFHFRERKETVSDTDFAPLSVTKSGVVPQLENAAKTDNNDNRKLVRRGDFAINSRSDRKGSAGISDRDGSVSVIYTVLEPRDTIDRRFAHYLLRSPAFQEEFYRWGNGIVADLWSTRFAAMKRIPLALPALPQQRAIADYLDRETAQIDTLIEEQQSLQSLLAERRGTLIDEALFDSCASEGSVPLKRMVRAVEQGVSPQAEGRLAQEPGSWGVLKSGCVNRGQFRPEEHKRLDDGFRFDQRLEVKTGDLLVSRASGSPDLVGSAGIVTPSKYRLILSDKTFRLLPEDSFSAEYLHLLLNSSRYREQVKGALSGADGLANNLPLGRLLNMRFPVLVGPAQAGAVKRVNSELSKIQRTLAEVEKFVELTRERRAALITAAVTGNLDLETS